MNTRNRKRRKMYFLAAYIFLIIINLVILILGIILAMRIIKVL